MPEADITARNAKAEQRARLHDIVAVATEEFAAGGYRGTNLATVADRLGITRQALYYYFPRKHDVLRAIVFSYFDELEDAVEEAGKLATTPGDRFVRMLGAHTGFVASQPVTTKVFMQESGNLTEEDRKQIVERRIRHQRRFTDAYRAGVAAHEFEDLPVSLVVNTVLGAGNWSYRWFNADGGMMNVADYAEFASRLLRYGFDRRPVDAGERNGDQAHDPLTALPPADAQYP